MTTLTTFFQRNPDIDRIDREHIGKLTALMVRFYRLPDKAKEAVEPANRNDTAMIKFNIRTETNLTYEQRVELSRRLDRIAWEANTGRIAEDVIM